MFLPLTGLLIQSKVFALVGPNSKINSTFFFLAEFKFSILIENIL